MAVFHRTRSPRASSPHPLKPLRTPWAGLIDRYQVFLRSPSSHPPMVRVYAVYSCHCTRYKPSFLKNRTPTDTNEVLETGSLAFNHASLPVLFSSRRLPAITTGFRLPSFTSSFAPHLCIQWSTPLRHTSFDAPTFISWADKIMYKFIVDGLVLE